MSKKEILAVFVCLLTCVIWSGNFIIARGVHEWIPPFTLAFWRWVAALAFILPFSFRLIIKEWEVIKSSYKYLLFMGVMGVGTYNTLVYLVAHHTTSNNIALISVTMPVFTIIFAAAIGIERFSRNNILGAVLAVTGALLVINKGNLNIVLQQQWNNADIVMLFAAMLWAVWSVALRFKPEGLSATAMLAVAIIIGLTALLPFYIYELKTIGATEFTWQEISIYLYIGIGASVFSWLLWQHAVGVLGPVKTSLIYYSLPIFTAGLAIVFLDEHLKLYHGIGFLLVFAGVLVSNRNKLGIKTG